MDREYTNIIRTLRLTIKDGRDEEMNISEPICLGGMKRFIMVYNDKITYHRNPHHLVVFFIKSTTGPNRRKVRMSANGEYMGGHGSVHGQVETRPLSDDGRDPDPHTQNTIVHFPDQPLGTPNTTRGRHLTGGDAQVPAHAH